MATTYQKISEQIRTTYFSGIPSDDAKFSLRYVAEMVAQEVAFLAKADAFENSSMGETTYANDQFISVFKLLPIVVADGEKSTVLPLAPAGLPKNQEIVSVRITGNKCLDCVPMGSKDAFMQDLIGLPKGFVFYKIEDSKIVYVTSNPLLEGTATIKMIGSVSDDGNILDAVLNVPKSTEITIIDRVLARLRPTLVVPQDNLNDSISQP